jgi:hypothetical protein
VEVLSLQANNPASAGEIRRLKRDRTELDLRAMTLQSELDEVSLTLILTLTRILPQTLIIPLTFIIPLTLRSLMCGALPCNSATNLEPCHTLHYR